MSFDSITIDSDIINLNLVKKIKLNESSKRLKFYFIDNTTVNYDFKSREGFEYCYDCILSLMKFNRAFYTNYEGKND